jgi:hypothetical protein
MGLVWNAERFRPTVSSVGAWRPVVGRWHPTP